VLRIGEIPDAFEFAGRKLDSPLPGGSLYRCRECSLSWRYPQPSKNQLDVLYQRDDVAAWQDAPARRLDWQLASGLIHRNDECFSVLDVGCFDGRFLDNLGKAYRRAGLEINSLAIEYAKAKGIHIVGQDFSDLDNLGTSFDVVVAMDVIEHVASPKSFLASMAKAARPGGLVIVSTGNTAAWSWRLMGGMYWYCSIAEHISFIDSRWCEHTSNVLGLTIEDIRYFSHEPSKVSVVAIQAAANIFYRMLPNLAYKLRSYYADCKGDPDRPSFRIPPHWRSAKDHMMVAFRVPTTGACERQIDGGLKK